MSSVPGTVEVVTVPPPRGPLSLHPKVISTATTAAAATLVMWAIHGATGFAPSVEQGMALVTVLGGLAGYVTPGDRP
jgi:hypothetical protein